MVMEMCNVSIWCEHYDDGNMLTLIVMVMMVNDGHAYHSPPMLTLPLMEMSRMLAQHTVGKSLSLLGLCH